MSSIHIIWFPHKSVRHRVPENKHVQPMFLCGGKVLTEEEAYAIHFQVQKLNAKLDVESYAENGYGSCDDPDVAAKVKRHANEIAKVYQDKADYDENWFRPLENTIEDYVQWDLGVV